MSRRLVEFTGGLEDWLSDQQRHLGKWRLKFINHMRKTQRIVGEQIKRLQKSHARKRHYDTGTLYKRIDFRIVEWNSIVFGIFEPDSDHYNIAGDHSPTSEFLDKYSGWQPSPQDKHYAEFRDDLDPFMSRIVDSIYVQQMTKEVNDFMDDNPIV